MYVDLLVLFVPFIVITQSEWCVLPCIFIEYMYMFMLELL